MWWGGESDRCALHMFLVVALVLRRCIRLRLSSARVFRYGCFVCVWTDCASGSQHQVYNILSLGTHAHPTVFDHDE